MTGSLEAALCREAGEPKRFSHPADHPLSGKFEEHMCALVRVFRGEGEYLSVQVRDAAGHSNITITSAYLHAAVDDSEPLGNLFGVR